MLKMKKMLSLLLAVVMTLAMGTTAFAAENPTINNDTVSVISVQQQGIDFVEITEIENGYNYKIYPQSTMSKVQVGYINVEIYGSGGKVKGKIWRVGDIDFTGTYQLLAGNTKATANSIKATESINSVPAWPFYNGISATPTKTQFWNVKLEGSLNGDDLEYSTYDFLFNKKAVEYPQLTDAFGNILMTVPTSATWSKTSSPLGTLSSRQLASYKTWYQNTYNNGEALNWTNIQIHHIKPRAYGGTHAYSNLMPLNKTVHSTVTTWWTSY